jgi:pyridoxine 5-phosphate synthase
MKSVKLSVNINKIALLRNSRGNNTPDILRFAADCERFGAAGITIHPRPDERHIKYQDAFDLKKMVSTELNIEGYPDERFLRMVEEVRPHQCTLVPDLPGALTSDHGWDTLTHQEMLTDIVRRLHEKGIRVSLFIDTDVALIDAAKTTGAERIELYTGPYAHDYSKDRAKAIAAYKIAAKHCKEIGLGVNAGHDLNLDNLAYFCEEVEGLLEVSIGHALVRDCLYYGLENVVSLYNNLLK